MKRVFHWAMLVLLLFLLQEALFRVVFPLPEIENFNRVNYSAFPGNDEAASFAWTRRPAMNATFRWNSKPDGASFDVHLNLYGFRDRDWSRKPSPGTERVMFVGDSLVEGFMSGDEETIPRGFARAAVRRKRRVEAMNFAIGGAGVEQYLALLRDAVPLFQPKRIVLIFYANDFPWSSSPAASAPSAFVPVERSGFTPRLLAVLGRAARNQVIPRRWHGPARLFVPVVPDPLNPWSNPPPQFSKIDPGIAEAMRHGDFNPYVVNLLNIAAAALRMPIEPGPTLRSLQEIAAKSNAELRLVYLPFPTQVSDYYVSFQQKYAFDSAVSSLLGSEYEIHSRALADASRRFGIPFLDLTALLRKAEAQGDHLYWNFDEHMRGAAYLRVGATIAAWMDSAGEIHDLVSLN